MEPTARVDAIRARDALELPCLLFTRASYEVSSTLELASRLLVSERSEL